MLELLQERKLNKLLNSSSNIKNKKNSKSIKKNSKVCSKSQDPNHTKRLWKLNPQPSKISHLSKVLISLQMNSHIHYVNPLITNKNHSYLSNNNKWFKATQPMATIPWNKYKDSLTYREKKCKDQNPKFPRTHHSSNHRWFSLLTLKRAFLKTS